jgi:hypothetical protein
MASREKEMTIKRIICHSLKMLWRNMAKNLKNRMQQYHLLKDKKSTIVLNQTITMVQ